MHFHCSYHFLSLIKYLFAERHMRMKFDFSLRQPLRSIACLNYISQMAPDLPMHTLPNTQFAFWVVIVAGVVVIWLATTALTTTRSRSHQTGKCSPTECSPFRRRFAAICRIECIWSVIHWVAWSLINYRWNVNQNQFQLRFSYYLE